MPPIRVMIVEDEGIVSIDIRNILNKMGYATSAVAFSGEEALQKINEFETDIVLMDIGLKGNIDGIDAAQIIIQNHRVPIIFLTGFADENTLERANNIGHSGYIIKPIHDEDLLKALKNAFPE